jgi:hypothetical protein
MKQRTLFLTRVLASLLLILSLPSTVPAQLISLKTVPVATGDQFLLFPSQNLGMGGVSIALDDILLDPFINPAKGARIRGTILFSSPAFYYISGDNGAARTLPLGILSGSERWFGSLFLSIQQLDLAGPDRFQPLLSERSSNNMYVFGSLGKKLDDSDATIGASIFWADLDGVDGVDMLYAQSQSIQQYGHIVDLRVGLLNEWAGDRSLEFLLLHHRVNMTHDVSYIDWILNEWEPLSTRQMRTEKNLDRSNTWGLHIGYCRPLSQKDWHIGTLLTGNWKTHPKIPNYEIMNIPRDPGNSCAYNIGVGLSRQREHSVFGVDFIYEPIWSNTWADAAESIETESGKTIRAGEKTVENDFKFSNSLVRLGLSREKGSFGFQIGIQARSIRYRLDQYDYIEEFRRKQRESWMEWTVSLGLILKFQEFQIRYLGRVTMGTGRPGTAFNNFATTREALAYYDEFSDFIIAPSGPMTLQDVTVLTHQITVSLPID